MLLSRHTRRRQFIWLLGGAAAWPLAARAQRQPVVGFLNPNKSDANPSIVAAFRAGLREHGFVEGDNVMIAYRWADGRAERLPGLAAELVRMQVAVIAATGGGSAAFAAKAATVSIPVVFNSASDPVKAGLVPSLNRPGGNLTGVGRLSVDLMPKRVELLREVIGHAGPVAYLIEGSSSVASNAVAQEAARTVGMELHVVQIDTAARLNDVIAGIVRSGARALLIGPSSHFNNVSQELGQLCASHRLPAIYQVREFVAAGGLMSYGPGLAEAYRIVGEYTGRVLKGAHPGDLPVQLQTKVEFIVEP